MSISPSLISVTEHRIASLSTAMVVTNATASPIFRRQLKYNNSPRRLFMSSASKIIKNVSFNTSLTANLYGTSSNSLHLNTFTSTSIRHVSSTIVQKKNNRKNSNSTSSGSMNSSSFSTVNASNEDGKDKNQFRKYVIVGGSTIAAVTLAFFGIRRYTTDSDNRSKQKNGVEKTTIIRIPANSAEIPSRIPYLLIGGGTASFSAFRSIKSSNPTAKVLVVSNEPYYPYMRPPLSKELWSQGSPQVADKLNFVQWNGSERSLFFEPEEFYIESKHLENEPKGGIAVLRGWNVKELRADEKKVLLDDGTEIEYDKCLIATGARPRTLPMLDKCEPIENKVTYFRNVDDFKTLLKTIEEKKIESMVIIGGGLLGSELACVLVGTGPSSLKVTQIFPNKGNLAKYLPEYLSSWTTKKIRARGVEIVPNVRVDSVSLSKTNKNQVELSLSNDTKLNTDHVIVAIGSEPNTDLASSSFLETDDERGGFVVNGELSLRSDLYAAGDCACYYDSVLGRRRVEHHDHAVTSGRVAGENMCGAQKSYSHQPMFWSELGPEIGLEAVGVIDSSLPTVAVYAKSDEGSEMNESNEKSSPPVPVPYTSSPKDGENYNKGVIFYLKDDIIIGIVLWNVFSRVGVARQVLKERKKFEDLNEVAKLFDIHST